MKISEKVASTPEIINEVKRSYNRLLKRQEEAGRYLDDTSIPAQEREKHVLAFKVEIIGPLEAYLQVLKDWGITVSTNEIMGGFAIE